MKTKEVYHIGYYKLANLSSILMIVFLGASAFIGAVRPDARLSSSTESIIAFCTVLGLVMLIPIFRSTTNFSRLAFYTPLVLLLFNTVLMQFSETASHYYLLGCLCACGISCLYGNFVQTLLFTIFQAIAAVILYLTGFPIAGPQTAWFSGAVALMVFLFSSAVLLVLTRLVTVNLTQAISEGNSFRTFLDTTANYLAMVDKSNHVIYVSTPLSKLAGIEDSELAKGRSIIDLFPGRELKVLAGKMLGQRELYEDDWEFVLDGQKRYFKAASNTLSGASGSNAQGGTLINLHDMTYLAERDEIAAMKDSLKIGLFFMDRNLIIQDNYSRYLEELLSELYLNGKCFTDLLSASVTAKELEAIKDYFGMIFDRVFDQATLEDINPLTELHYVHPEGKIGKIFQCEFVPVEQARGEVFILVTIYDITAKIELQQRLKEEENRRQEEMSSLFELVQVNPTVFSDFLSDVEYEFSRIDDILKNDSLSTHEALVEVYQSVHAIKSNSVILGLATFGNKVHTMESMIKKLREQEDNVSFDDMLHLTVAIERLSEEKESFKDVIEKINAFKIGGESGEKQNEQIFLATLGKTVEKAASDLGKKVRFAPMGIDSIAIEKGPRRLMKEVLMQLIRNAVVHGIEMPEDRIAGGKNETGTIRLSIKVNEKTIHVKLTDDGKGLDFDGIREKALRMNLIQEQDGNNREQLLQAMFSPGFSTSKDEGLHAGRGIGLNLVKDRVRDAKGSIKLQTELHKGTIFNIFLPLEAAQ